MKNFTTNNTPGDAATAEAIAKGIEIGLAPLRKKIADVEAKMAEQDKQREKENAIRANSGELSDELPDDL